MSGTIPTDPEARDLLAAEYVLGTLDARQSAAVEAALATDLALADAVAAWTNRLAPLTRLAPPEAPPPDLWDRIAARLPGATPLPGGPRPAPVPRARFWQAWAIGASLAAAVFATIAFLPRAESPGYVTVLVSDSAAPAWIAQADREGGITLAAVRPAFGEPQATTPEGRVMQLWAQRPGDANPTSIALLPRTPGRVTIPAPALRPVNNMLIAISLEPEGGSPTGRPTGPILFYGRLIEAPPN
jgi:anti-sigma-K factor RskA